MERALLVTIKLSTGSDGWSVDDTAQELEELVSSAGCEAVDNIVALIRDRPTPKDRKSVV